METGFEDPLWSHRKQRRHHQARSISCPGMQLDDMMLVMESDSDYYRILNPGLWTALHGGDGELQKWWFDRPVRMSLSVAKNHDVPVWRCCCPGCSERTRTVFCPGGADLLGKTWTDESELARNPVATSSAQGSRNEAPLFESVALYVSPWPR